MIRIYNAHTRALMPTCKVRRDATGGNGASLRAAERQYETTWTRLDLGWTGLGIVLPWKALLTTELQGHQSLNNAGLWV